MRALTPLGFLMRRHRQAGWGAIAFALLAAAALAGCSSRDADLQRFIAQVDSQPGGHVDPLPEIKPYQAYTYADQALRSPFTPGGAEQGLRPDPHRVRQYLEQFPLDTLKMVGTLAIGGHDYGLVQTMDGRVHRVLVGQYMGQNDGKITEITPAKIYLREIVPDGLGGYLERPAAVALSE